MWRKEIEGLIHGVRVWRAMPGRNSYRVAYRHEGKLYRLTRIVYGTDGSYYVTAQHIQNRRRSSS